MRMKFKDQKEQHEFEKWAFGRIEPSYTYSDMHVWNSLHGDLYFIEEKELIGESLDKMFTLWMEHGRNDKKRNHAKDKFGAREQRKPKVKSSFKKGNRKDS